PLAKASAEETDCLAAGRKAIDDRCFGRPGAAARQKHDRVLRAIYILEVLQYLGDHLAKLRRAVIRNGLGELQEGLLRNRHRAGRQQALFHRLASFSTRIFGRASATYCKASA